MQKNFSLYRVTLDLRLDEGGQLPRAAAVKIPPKKFLCKKIFIFYLFEILGVLTPC